MTCSVAIISKDNSPLYVLAADMDKETELQYNFHSALDIVDEKSSNTANKNFDSFLGMLYATELYKIYGYMTNTKIKFILIVDSLNSALRENEVRNIFRSLHVEYTNYISNPFTIPNEPIFSKSFDKNIRNICKA
ncbi:hypothetical protein PVAND_008054 [Polypedilum vanderplanki]|uniref:Trafficking protein particle complex subunit 2-like protein n=1 Tax=Polypedilum vanderplanki TaxID=319348 RepID=A0A9J6C892_POLVA|nr:hypothetical protein PVAND_008054 [Polypedilum vanderplanki]